MARARPAISPARLEPDVAWAPREAVDEETFKAVLRDSIAAVEGAGVFYVLIGGLASTLMGRQRWTWDIDLLVARDDARSALAALEAAGFTTEESDEQWLFKAHRDDVLVDILFEAAGTLQLDDAMRAHAWSTELMGVPVRVAAPEDVIVMKALAHREDVPRYWFDALGMLTAAELDWDYLLERARHGPRRLLALLAYAQSEDLAVPDAVMKSLYASIYGD
jgi:Uncharacterised nucleotidyltransferase